jgi:hypothetical protein
MICEHSLTRCLNPNFRAPDFKEFEHQACCKIVKTEQTFFKLLGICARRFLQVTWMLYSETQLAGVDISVHVTRLQNLLSGE